MSEEQAAYTADKPVTLEELTEFTLNVQLDLLDTRARLDKLQDANLGPVLESSAVLVELRRIADALETLAKQGQWTANAYGSNSEIGWLRTQKLDR